MFINSISKTHQSRTPCRRLVRSVFVIVEVRTDLESHDFHLKTEMQPLQNPHCQITQLTGLCTHNITLAPAYNTFSYEFPPTTSRYLSINIIDRNVKKFGYYQHLPTTSSFLSIYLPVLKETQCNCTRQDAIKMFSHPTSLLRKNTRGA